MDEKTLQRFEELLEDVNRRFGERVLHVLNGQAMYDALAGRGLSETGDAAPFNEAMCAHEACAPIFGEAFVAMRAAGHGVTPEDYARITLAPLQPLFDGKHGAVALWFGDDMFCQMNLLTVLAYLEQTAYRGEVVLMTVKESSDYGIEETPLPGAAYPALYEQVLAQRRYPADSAIPALPFMERGIRLYFETLKPDNAITDAIRNNAQLPKDALIGELLRRFPEYGLGDTQYAAMIEAELGRPH